MKMKNFLFVFLSLIKFGFYVSAKNDYYDDFWVIKPRNFLFPPLPIVAPISKDETCKSDSRTFLSALKNKTRWAVQMLDSSAKAPTGVLPGTIFQLGNYDECLKTKAPFKVQFCVIQVFVDLSNFNKTNDNEFSVWTFLQETQNDSTKVSRSTLNWGLCIPLTCKTSEMEKAINSYLTIYSSNFSDNINYKASLKEEFCTNDDKFEKFSISEICLWVVLFTLILATGTSTLIDFTTLSQNYNYSKLWKLWMFFSIKQNYLHLLPEKKKIKNSLDVFHGIKVISILVIVFGHRIGISLSLSATNFNDVEETLIKNHKMFFIQSDLVVDTFFFISGLLACYIMMQIYTKQFINPIFAILVRLSRLAPVYFLIIWFQSSAALRIGSGPLWNALARNETQFCVDNWWTNVLFISNYVKTNEMCMPHSWFIPCELHFFSIAAVLVPILVRFPKLGKIILIIGLIVSAIIPAVVIYTKKVHPLILFYYKFLFQPRNNKSFNVLYIKSHNRATVYLIGLAVGYFLFRKKDSKKKLSKITTLSGCFVWLALMFAPMAYGSLYYDSHRKYNLLEAAVFGSVRRILWALGFSVFILSHRFGTIRNKFAFIDFFFSSRVAIFLSKITYGIYLLHYGFITSDVMSTKVSKKFSVHDTVIEVSGDLLKSGAATIILHFIFEIPLKRILKEFIFAKQTNKIFKAEENQNNKAIELQNVFTIRL